MNGGSSKDSVNTADAVDNIIEGKGDFVAAGTTCLVERLPGGDVIKSPLLGANRSREAVCREDLATEAAAYERLGKHPRLVEVKQWDPVQCTLTLEYMRNGTLKSYVGSRRASGSGGDREQRARWVAQAAEAVQLLHAAGIVHCDIGPHNFLLDDRLDLRICDFGGSSMDGRPATVCPGVRYAAPPGPDWKPGKPPAAAEDLFALGSTIFFIVTGAAPFAELPDDRVEAEFRRGSFPPVDNIRFGRIIAACWQQTISSAQELCDLVRRDQAEP